MIFGASTDLGSSSHTSRIIEPVLHFLLPTLSQDSVDLVVVSVRKCGHLSEYALLALMILRARRAVLPAEERGWRWRVAVEAFWVTVLYAATDELHQTFVPSREGCLRDVVIDSTGGLAGLLGLWALGKWRKWW